MLIPAASASIFVYTEIADSRKGIQGLSGIVRDAFGADPTDGRLFAFINRRRDRMKVLHFDEGGFWLYYRVLEAGTLEFLKDSDKPPVHSIDATELSMLLSGVSLVVSDARRKRYSKRKQQVAELPVESLAELTLYLSDLDLPIDNNECEQLMKQVALGRKKWLFCGSVAGGERNAGFMGLTNRAHRNDLVCDRT